MTCWSLYSLYHLAHEEYFPKLLRLVNFYVAFLIRGVFLAAMYSTQYASGSPSIIWTAVVAWAAALPFPFLFGNLFIKKFYKHTLHKYEVIGKMKGVFNKDSVK